MIIAYHYKGERAAAVKTEWPSFFIFSFHTNSKILWSRIKNKTGKKLTEQSKVKTLVPFFPFVSFFLNRVVLSHLTVHASEQSHFLYTLQWWLYSSNSLTCVNDAGNCLHAICQRLCWCRKWSNVFTICLNQLFDWTCKWELLMHYWVDSRVAVRYSRDVRTQLHRY